VPVCWLRRISLQLALANQRQLWPVAIAMMWPLSSRASSTVATTWWSNSGGSRPSRRSMVSRSSLSLAASCSVSVGTLMFVSRIADQARMACAAQDRAWARSPSRSGPHLALALGVEKVLYQHESVGCWRAAVALGGLPHLPWLARVARIGARFDAVLPPQIHLVAFFWAPRCQHCADWSVRGFGIVVQQGARPVIVRSCMAHLPANRLAARSRSSPALILALPVNATSSSRKNSTWRGTL